MKQLNSERTNYPVSESERENIQARKQKPISSDELINLYYDEIKQFLARSLSRTTWTCATFDSEDLTQEVFIKACRGLENLCSEDSLRPWLYIIAKNVLIDFLRQTNKKDRVPIPLAGDKEYYGGCINKGVFSRERVLNLLPDYKVFIKEILQKVMEQISLLPPKQQDTVILSRLQSLSDSEISKELTCSKVSVHSSVTAGIRRLRQKLQWEYY